MIKRILVPVDGSTDAEAALPLAIGLSSETGAEVRLALVHTASDQHLQQYLDATVEGVRRQLVSEEAFVSAVFLEGPVVPALCNAAAAADLVVMSSHGHGGFARMWIGSVTDAVLRRSPVPVVVVKPDVEGVASSTWPIRRIIVPLDGSGPAEVAIQPALALGGQLGASVTLYRAVSPAGTTSAALLHSSELGPKLVDRLELEARTNIEAVRSEVDDGSCPVDVAVTVHRNPAMGILDFLETSGADLVVMAARTRYPLARALLGSVTDKIVRGSAVPVLVVRARKKSPLLGGG